MDAYTQAISNIIKEQQTIIGPLAIDQAKKISGINFSDANVVNITGNGKEILADLVKEYANFFGRVSIEVCKDAIREVKPTISTEELPEILR